MDSFDISYTGEENEEGKKKKEGESCVNIP